MFLKEIGKQIMTRKANRLAETVVTATSRRGFLGRFARLAGGAAAALAGLAAMPARAAKPEKPKLCCVYYPWDSVGDTFWYVCMERKKCPQKWRGAELWWQYPVSDCSHC
jgi:hypothetical protein